MSTLGSNAERTYSDPARSCSRRARFAAVFAVTTLWPPDLGPEAEPDQPETKPEREPTPPARVVAPEPVAAEPPRPPPAPPATPPWLLLDLSAVAEQALNSSAELALRGFGAELGAVLGRGTIAPAVTLAYAPNREVAFDAARVSLTRAQLAMSAHVRVNAAPFALGGELGVVTAFSRVRGNEFEHPESGTALDLGLRLRATSSLVALRAAPLLAVEVAAFPKPTNLRAEPQGSLGRLPVLWLGVSFGVRLGL